MELYNVRDLKLCIKQVLYTPSGSKCRLHNNFINLNLIESKYVFLIYSGKTRFIEIGFNNIALYNLLRYIFKNASINQIILKVIKYAEVIRE